MSAREKYAKQLMQKNEDRKAGRSNNNNKKGPICPRYLPKKKGAKACKHFVKGGACALFEAFLCVEYMRSKGHNQNRIRDACAELARIPVDARASKPPAKQQQQKVVALMQATEKDIAELEAIRFSAALDVPHLGGVRIVNKYISDGTRQLSIRHALCLAAVASVFPGATVAELVIQPQPGPKEDDS